MEKKNFCDHCTAHGCDHGAESGSTLYRAWCDVKDTIPENTIAKKGENLEMDIVIFDNHRYDRKSLIFEEF